MDLLHIHMTRQDTEGGVEATRSKRMRLMMSSTTPAAKIFFLISASPHVFRVVVSNVLALIDWQLF